MSEEKKQKRQEINNKQRRSWQLDLFTNFLANDEKEKRDLSNAIRSWDQMPRYFPARTLAKYAKENPGKPFSWSWVERDRTEWEVVIQPALIKKGEDYVTVFPSTNEAVVEEVLKKFLSVQSHAIHDPDNVETWVKFTLSMIYKELSDRDKSKRRKSRSKQEIKKSIQVMNKCNISYLKNGEEIWSGAMLQDLITVGRKEYIEDATAYHAARLPMPISLAINAIEYRQFNYERLMSMRRLMASWIYKKLIHDYTYASPLDTHHFMYSMLKQKSGLLQQARESDNRKLVIDALEELKENKVLISYKTEEDKNENGGILDVKYIVTATVDFSREQKASNKRVRDTVKKTARIKERSIKNRDDGMGFFDG